MKTVRLAAGLLQVLVLVIVSAVMIPGSDPFQVSAHQCVMQLSTRGSTRELIPGSNRFQIAETGNIEPSSAVAYGGGHHVVVYTRLNRESNKSVSASVMPGQDDNPTDDYRISDQEFDCKQPAIAYHAKSGLFIILYKHHHNEIYAQLFSPTTTDGKIGPVVLISDNATEKGHPVIACNQLNGVCLVAYQQDGTDIKGRYIGVNDEKFVVLSDVYDLASVIAVDQPRLAWGRDQGTFLLAYNEQAAAGETRPSFTHLYDQYDPTASDIRLHPSAPVLPAELFPPDNDALVSDIAFDPCTEQFVLTIDYDEAGNPSGFDLWAAMVHASQPNTTGVFTIANSTAKEHGGAIHFITPDDAHPPCGNRDRLVVAYINDQAGLLAAELRGNSHPSAPSYEVDPVKQHLLVANHTIMYQVSSPSLTHHAQDMGVLVVYEHHYLASEEYDIWGNFLSINTYNYLYLPLVMR